MSPQPRILIVEDEAVIALDLEQHLIDLGYAVVGIAATGQRALELTRSQAPDLIVMDIMIKGPIDGITAAHDIRAEFDVPVVFLTAFSDPGTLERVRQVAPYGYLGKPFRPGDLRTTLDVALHRHRLERQLQDGERWLSSTLQCLGDGVIASDEHGHIRFMNPVAENLVGRRRNDVLGAPVHEVFALHDADAQQRLPDPTGQVLASGWATRLEAGTLRAGADAEPVPVEVQASPIRDERQRLLGAVLVFRDISERRRTEAALARLAHLDTLTGLPNRAALMPQLDAMVSNAMRLGSTLAVLFLDLDGFKVVNDTCGHGAGDELLIDLGRRLKASMRVGDFVARLGGDEFVVLAGNLARPEMAQTIAHKLIETIGREFKVGGRSFTVTASIGISLCPADSIEAEGLLRKSDEAMYSAKQAGKNRFVVHAVGPAAATGVAALAARY